MKMNIICLSQYMTQAAGFKEKIKIHTFQSYYYSLKLLVHLRKIRKDEIIQGVREVLPNIQIHFHPSSFQAIKIS